MILALSIFILAGVLGLLTFHLPVREPLLPLLSGLFGLSNLFFSLKSKTKLPPQKIKPLREIFLTKELLKSATASIIFAPFCSFLPGIGSGHAATLGNEFIKQDNRGFLFMLGAINTIVMGLSYVTVYTINKARTGTAAAVQQLLTTITTPNMIIILTSIFITGIISFFLAIYLSAFFSKNINKINYTKLTIVVIVLIIIINFIFTNWLGLIILAAGTSIGFFAISSRSRRINLMACLILPSIVYYLFN
jgi:putative membrane protein